jgi:hypothetical protein
MRKKLYGFLICSIIITLAFWLSGCGDNYDPGESYFQLDYVKNITFNESTFTLSWDASANAKEYEILVGYEGFYAKLYTNETSYSIDPELFIGVDGLIPFMVRAIGYKSGNNVYSTSIIVEHCHWMRVMQRLTDPTNVTFNRETGRLSWDTVSDATFYIVKQWTDFNSANPGIPPNDAIETQTSNLYIDYGNQFDGVTPVFFLVQACNPNPDCFDSPINGNNRCSSWIKLAKPTNLHLTTGLIYFQWDPVPYAAYYYVEYSFYWNGGSILQRRTVQTTENSVKFQEQTTATLVSVTVYASNVNGGFADSDKTP